MLTVEDALHAVLQRVGPLPARRCRLDDVAGCVLAEDIVADIDLPPFDKALMDGYAVRTADLVDGPPFSLRVGEQITAGQTPSRPLACGEAAVIMTGAPLPPGADAVVMHEQTEPLDQGWVLLRAAVTPGQNRLPQGRELKAGEVVLRHGQRLNAAKLGLLASVGRESVAVRPRPRVAIVPTGDELVRPSQVPGPGQIRETNSVSLAALVRAGGALADALPIAPDEPGPLQERLNQALGEADVLLISGGVSAGQKDLVPSVLEALGVERVFHKVRLKPGKPLWFGVGPERPRGPGVLVFGLPGNPVSGLVCFLVFVRPVLNVMRGHAADTHPTIPARLAAPFQHRGDRPTYHPSRVTHDANGLRVEPLDWAGSADLRTVAQADGFAVFPAGDRWYDAQEPVAFLPIPDIL